jgi:mRNA interferase RelE/StbE
MAFVVEIDTKAAREIRALPRNVQERVMAKVVALAENPRPAGCVKLSGAADYWRIRSGDFRIIYQILDTRLVITVVKVGHRREVYRGM